MVLSFSGSYPATYGLFTAIFKEPEIPVVASDFHGFFLQHKWSDQVSHITAGYWYNSANNSKVRIDETYEGTYGSSLFDYTNTSSTGGVSNIQVIVGPSFNSNATCFNDYVENPGFPLVVPEFLQAQNATFGGVMVEPFLGEVQTWDLLYDGAIPVIAYLNHDDPPLLVGYDFWSPVERTKVVTRFYAHQVEVIGAEVFENFSCPA